MWFLHGLIRVGELLQQTTSVLSILKLLNTVGFLDLVEVFIWYLQDHTGSVWAEGNSMSLPISWALEITMVKVRADLTSFAGAKKSLWQVATSTVYANRVGQALLSVGKTRRPDSASLLSWPQVSHFQTSSWDSVSSCHQDYCWDHRIVRQGFLWLGVPFYSWQHYVRNLSRKASQIKQANEDVCVTWD